MALRNDGLLHAILALAALHIAKLQGDHITASLKHYSISLRRIGKSVSHPARKNRLATLAAALVLALYECWCADHQKWSNHLLGARMLLKEIDFAPMTKYIKSMKLKQRQEEEAQNFPGMQQAFGGFHEDGSIYQRANEDVDENEAGKRKASKAETRMTKRMWRTERRWRIKRVMPWLAQAWKTRMGIPWARTEAKASWA